MSENNENETKDQPVTISAPPKSVEIDPQNPLPEPSFFWRRVIAMVIAAVALFFVWHILEALHDLKHADNLLTLAQWVIGFAWFVLTYYFIAPSAAELTSLVQSAAIIKRSLALADSAPKPAANRPESGQAARFAGSGLPDSHFSGSGAGEAPGGLSGDLADSGEQDAAPRGRP